MNPQLTAFSLSSQASAQGSLSHGNLSRIKTARPVASLVESLRMSREKARLDRLRCGSARSKQSTPIRSLNITLDNITLMSKHSPDGTQVSSKSDQQVTPAPEVVEKLKMQVFELEQRLQDVKRTTNGISELEACHEKLAQECSTRKASHCSSEMQLMKEELALKNTLLLQREEAKEVSTQPPTDSNDDLHEQLAQKDALLRQRESELNTKDATLVAMRAENSALREKAQRDVGQKEIGDIGRSETCVCCNTLSTEVDCLRIKLKDMAAKLAKVPARVKSNCDSDENFAELRKQLETKDMTIRILENRLTREKTETQSAIRRLERARPNSPSRRPESRAGSPLPSDPGRKDRLARSIRKYYQYSVDGASMTTPGYPKSETVFEDETHSNISLASSKPMFAAFPKTEFLYRQCHKSAASNQNSPSQTAALDSKPASVLPKDGDQTVLTSASAEVKDADVFATSAGSGPEKSNFSPPRVDTVGLSQVEVGPDIPPVSISPANDGADCGSYNHAAVDIGLIANYTSDSFENGNIEALGKVDGSQDIFGNHGPAGVADLIANSSGHFHVATNDNPQNDPLSKEYFPNDRDAVGPLGYVNGSGNASHSSAHPSNSHPVSHENKPGPISNNRGPTDTTAVFKGDTAALFGGTADTAALFTGTSAGDTAALFGGTADSAALFTGTSAGDTAALFGSTAAPVAVDTPSLFEGTAAPVAGDKGALFEAIASPVAGSTAALFTGTAAPVVGDTAALFAGTSGPVAGDTAALFTGTAAPVVGDTAARFEGRAAPVAGDTATLWTGTSVPVAGDTAALFEDTAGPVAGDTAALFAGDTAALFGSTDAPVAGDSAALFTGTTAPVAGNTAARFTDTPAPVAGDTAALFGGDNDLPDIPGLFGASVPNPNPGHHFATTGNNAVTATEVYNPSGATISFAQSQAYVDTRATPSTAPVVPARIVQAVPARNVQNAPFQAKPNAIDSLFNAHNEEDDFFSKMCADNEANKAVSEAFKLSANPQPFSEKAMPLAGAESGFNRANLTSTSQTRDSAQFSFRTHPHDATTPFGFSTANTSFGSQPYNAATVYTPATRDPGLQEISSATHVPAQPTHVPAQQFPAKSYPSVSAFQPATLAPAKSKPAISGDVSSLFD